MLEDTTSIQIIAKNPTIKNTLKISQFSLSQGIYSKSMKNILFIIGFAMISLHECAQEKL